MDHIIAAVDAVDTVEPRQLDFFFDKAVRTVQGLEHFENKHRVLELACGQWLEMSAGN